MRAGWWILAAVGIALTALVIWLAAGTSGALQASESKIRLISSLGFLVLIGSAVLVRWRHRPMLLVRHLVVWSAVGLVLIVAYSYRFEAMRLAERIRGELMPSTGIETAPGTVAFRAGDDGHFRIDAVVDGAKIRFLVDTGATVISLSPVAARSIGFDLDRLAYTQRFQTANGTGRGAPVRLREIVVGPIRMRDVPASVNKAEMAGSLLGIEFLRRLKGYEVRDGVLLLRY